MQDLSKIFSGPCDFVTSAADPGGLPPANRPEVAFAGRSNVGKSSLVNALTGRKTLAKTSNTPGRTQQLNYFDLGGRMYLVDMPGYGYAQVSRSQKKNWEGLIRAYLRKRENLRCVFLLVDARHGLKESDTELMTMLDKSGVSYRIVLTKTDKVKESELEKIVADIQAALRDHVAGFPEASRTSAETLEGIEELRGVVAGYITDLR
jgi:GTP-binding protein